MKDIVPLIKKVSFELSNLCNFAEHHRECPAHFVKTPIFLPSAIVLRALYSLFAAGYHETIAWYIYSEPLIDPRLMMLVDYTTRLFDKKIKQRIITNGQFLDQTLLDELFEAGITYFKIDAYRPRDLAHARTLVPKKKIEKFKISRKSLDDRLNLYELPDKNLDWPCYAPYADVNIKCDGRVALCSIDWRTTISFGNLHSASLEEILGAPAMRKTYDKLSRGNRVLEVCRKCNRQVTGAACLKKDKYFEEET